MEQDLLEELNKGGCPRSAIWDEFDIGESDGKGHYEAKCRYCIKGKWQHGRPSVMESHLALHCKGETPDQIRRYWLIHVAKRNDKVKDTDNSDNESMSPSSSKKPKVSQSNFKSIEPVSSKKTLDGWSNPTNDSLYNFIISTSERKEYLYSLLDFSDAVQTGEFLASKISEIIDRVGSNKFMACVTDNGSNICVACEVTTYNYSHIWNIKCIAYAINLISNNIVKTQSVNQVLKQASQIIQFFKKSHLACRLLRKGIENMNISDGGLETYTKTRWVSIFETTSLIIRLRP
ncbi:23741_t:CDS:2, partial [Cetraspora pellucida]